MRNYWSCSKFANWLRGTTKPKWGTGDEWKDWSVQAKANHPIRWWITEEGLDHVQDAIYFIPKKISDVRYYINNRFITHSNALVAHPRDIAPGTWYDVGDRFIFCLFNSLVDFVEIETAWMHVVWDEDARKKYKTSWLRRKGWRGWRSREAGIAHLDWAAALTNSEWMDPSDPLYGQPTQQALQAKEIKELYLWWTDIRPTRPDIFDVSGWTDYCNNKRDRGIGLLETDPEENKEDVHKKLTLIHDLEALQEAEDTEMLIRLIKVRNGLWT